MTINKLLAGAAIAALLAGGAQAQTVAINGGAGEVGSLNTFASEVDLDALVTADQPKGSLVLNVDFSGAPFVSLGAADQVDFVVALSGFEFSAIVTSANFVEGVDADCTFAIQSGGGSGTTTVVFRSADATINACTGADAVLTLPVRLTGSTASAQWETRLVGPNSLIDSGSFDDMVAQAPAFGLTLVATDDVLESASNFSTFDSGPAGTDADVGTVAFTNAGLLGDLATWTVLDPNDVLGAANTVTLDFVDASGVASATIGGVACVLVGNSCTLERTAAQVIAYAGAVVNIVSEDDDTMPIAAQQLSMSIAYDTPQETFYSVTDPAGDIGELTRDNTVAVGALANFEWVRIGTGGTESNFRIVFTDADDVAAITAINVAVAAGKDVPLGSITLTEGDSNSGFVKAGNTITFNSRALGAVLGQEGNADVTGISMQFDPGVSDASGAIPGADVRRMLVNRTPGSFVATPGLESDNDAP